MRFSSHKTLGEDMKKFIIAATISTILMTGASTAGSLADPILEQDLIIEEATSDGGLLVPLIFLILALGPQLG
jgi:hypothetical protein